MPIQGNNLSGLTKSEVNNAKDFNEEINFELLTFQNTRNIDSGIIYKSKLGLFKKIGSVIYMFEKDGTYSNTKNIKS